MSKVKSLLFRFGLLLISANGLTNVFAQGGYNDTHEDNAIITWHSVGARPWVEENGFASPKQGDNNSGFLITDYPCADDGTFEVTMKADQWNGQRGGIVVRWLNENQYYFICVQPGNQWSSYVKYCKNTTNPDNGTVLRQNIQTGTEFTLKAVVTGNTISVYLNDAFVGSFIDNDNKYGRVGYGYDKAWDAYTKFNSSKWVDAAGSPVTKEINPGKIDPKDVNIKVFIKDEGLNQNNELKPRFYVKNVGTVTLHNFNAYYYFTVEPGMTPILNDYYTPDCEPALLDLGNNQWCVEFRYRDVNLAPDQITPDLAGSVVGIHYPDWVPMDKTNDFSNPKNPDFTETPTVTVVGAAPDVDTDVSYTPTATSIPASSVPLKMLTIQTLKCNETEDDAGEDECYLQYFVDGEFVDKLPSGGTHDLNDGDSWDVNKSEIYFKNQAKIRLWDEDVGEVLWPLPSDDDDDLGTITIDGTDGEFTGSFTQDDANYTITYKVETVYVPQASSTPGDLAFNNFKNSTTSGVWTKISKSDLINNMVDRMKNPITVNQGDKGFCGQAAIVHELLKKSKIRYVYACRQVYEQGSFVGVKNTYYAPENCKSLDGSTFNESVADWILLTTFSGDDSPTSAWTLQDQVADIIGYVTTDYTSCVLYGEFDALQDGINAVNAGGLAFLNVYAGKIPGQNDDAEWYKFGFDMNHWIALLGVSKFERGEWYNSDGHVRLKAFTWGQEIELDYNEGDFEDFLFGVVYGSK